MLHTCMQDTPPTALIMSSGVAKQGGSRNGGMDTHILVCGLMAEVLYCPGLIITIARISASCVSFRVTGLESLELMMDKENMEHNRGFGFMTFYNYACAEAARRKLVEAEYQ